MATNVTGDSIIRLMRLVCWMTKSRNMRLEYVTLIIFTTEKVVTRTHLNFTLYIHCLSCYGYRIVHFLNFFLKFKDGKTLVVQPVVIEE